MFVIKDGAERVVKIGRAMSAAQCMGNARTEPAYVSLVGMGNIAPLRAAPSSAQVMGSVRPTSGGSGSVDVRMDGKVTPAMLDWSATAEMALMMTKVRHKLTFGVMGTEMTRSPLKNSGFRQIMRK